MQKALEILGYENPYHFSSMYGNVKDADMWMEALRAKYKGIGTFGRADWDKLLGHVAAVTDAPCNVFAPELLDAYPDAKVILVEREIESWYKSWEQALVLCYSWAPYVLSYTDPMWYGRIYSVGLFWLETQLHATTLRQAQQNSRDVYREHYAEVRRIARKENLLEYELGSGWKPLCDFLDKEVPDIPFPHLNESQSLKKMFDQMGIKSMKTSLKNVAMIVSAGAAAGLAIYWAIK